MGKTERKFWEFLIRHRWKVFVLFATLLSVYARFAFRGFLSTDMREFLIPWYSIIQGEGGLKALAMQVGNYQISYQTLIALMTCLPVGPVYAYKILSVLFDYAMGAAAAAMTRRITNSPAKAAAVYAAVVILPVTVLNSAAWGQCDSIYTFFLILTFLLLQKKPTGAFLCYGVALAFKLQTVFLLPFLLFYYVWSQRIPWWKFLLIPVPALVFSAGGLLQGRSLPDILNIYVAQGSEYQQISLNYPSFWNLFVKNMAENGADHYSETHVLCITVTVILLGGIMLRLIREKNLDRRTLMIAAVLMMYTCVLFLPAMHERYAYPVIIFLVMACAGCPKLVPAALGMLIIDLQTYGLYLMGKEVPSWELLAVLNLACYAWIAFCLWIHVRDGDQGKRGGHPSEERKSILPDREAEE